MAKLIPDGLGGYKYIDLRPGDLISDQFGNYKFYDPDEKIINTYTTTNTNKDDYIKGGLRE